MVERVELDSLPPTRPDPLAAWGLGTFHACLLVVLLVLLLYRAGRAGDLLGGTGTGPGLLLFVALWGLSGWTTWRALRGVMEGSRLVVRRGVVVGRAAAWGGVAGALFLPVLVAVLLLPPVVADGGVGPGLLLAVPFLLVAMGVAFVVGSLVGLLFGTLDVLLLGARDALLRKPG